jgi:hypothetical protein
MTVRDIVMAAAGAQEDGFASTISSFVTTIRGATTINYPTTPQAGDIAVLMTAAFNNSATIPGGVLATGFTNISNSTNTNVTESARLRIMYRLCTGSEGASVSNLMTVNDYRGDLLFLFRPNIPATSVTIGDIEASVVYASTPTAQTITGSGTTGDAVISMAFGVDTGTSFDVTTGMGFSPTQTDQEVDDQGYIGCKWRYETSANAQNTSANHNNGSEGFTMGLQTFYISLFK